MKMDYQKWLWSAVGLFSIGAGGTLLAPSVMSSITGYSAWIGIIFGVSAFLGGLAIIAKSVK